MAFDPHDNSQKRPLPCLCCAPPGTGPIPDVHCGCDDDSGPGADSCAGLRRAHPPGKLWICVNPLALHSQLFFGIDPFPGIPYGFPPRLPPAGMLWVRSGGPTAVHANARYRRQIRAFAMLRDKFTERTQLPPQLAETKPFPLPKRTHCKPPARRVPHNDKMVQPNKHGTRQQAHPGVETARRNDEQ